MPKLTMIYECLRLWIQLLSGGLQENIPTEPTYPEALRENIEAVPQDATSTEAVHQERSRESIEATPEQSVPAYLARARAMVADIRAEATREADTGIRSSIKRNDLPFFRASTVRKVNDEAHWARMQESEGYRR